jgi:hypothetical protein
MLRRSPKPSSPSHIRRLGGATRNPNESRVLGFTSLHPTYGSTYGSNHFSPQSTMLKHFVLSLNPHAQFEWERCTLHNPITAGQPNLAQLVGQVVSQNTGQEAGSYLVSIDIEVTVLEAAAIEQSVNRLIGKLELPTLSVAPTLVDVAA